MFIFKPDFIFISDKNIILFSFILIFLTKTKVNLKIIRNQLFSIVSSSIFL